MKDVLVELEDLLAEYQNLYEANEEKIITLQIQREILKHKNIDYDIKIKEIMTKIEGVMANA